MARVRLDSLLAERGLFPSRSRAAAAVIAGDVHLGPGRRRAEKPGQLVAADVELDIVMPPQFVSRGGIKLANGLDARGIEVAGRHALDVGASTGGFTDCLLQRGATHVVALDVAYGELAFALRDDPRVTVLERTNARALEPLMLPYHPDLIVADVSFISLAKVLPAVLACAAARFDALVLVKPQFEVGRERIGKGGVVRDPQLRRAAMLGCRRGRARAGSSGARLRIVRPARPGGKPRDLRPPGRERPQRRAARPGRCGARDRAMTRFATVLTHRRAADTTTALAALIAAAGRAGVTLRFDAEETSKHGLEARQGIDVDTPPMRDADLCVVMGGDGTILTALREYAGTTVPVFAVNFGEVGFLATLDPDGLDADFDRAFAGEFDTLELPGITVGRPDGSWLAMNDISVHRKPGFRVADLGYALAGEEIGRVRCDGLVVATPQGSTGYNLANGGPVLAWGVAGFVVSFIAPHSLTARSLVVAPDDLLTINNRSREEPVEIHVDGRPVVELGPGEDIHVEFARVTALLAQLPGASFYHRLRERFGRLAR